MRIAVTALVLIPVFVYSVGLDWTRDAIMAIGRWRATWRT